MATKSELRQLADLISAQVQSIEDVYASHHKPIPHLNDPNPEPFIDDPNFTKSAFLIVAAASRLAKSLSNPIFAVQEAASAMYSSASISVAVEAHVTEVLREAGPQGMHVQEIATKVGIDSEKLGRVLRYLCAAEHIYREISPNVFTNNRLSSILDTGLSFESLRQEEHGDNPYHFPKGYAAITAHTADVNMTGANFISKTILDRETSFSRDPNKTPLMRAMEFDGEYWEWIELPHNRRVLQRFSAAIKNWDKAVARKEAITAYDWGSLPSGSIVVDVGGGVGGCALQLFKAFPHLRFCLQDRPQVVADGKQLWETNNPDALKSGLVQFQAHNFFDDQPIKNASVFLLRFIMHNWPDSKAKQILEKLSAVANEDTRLVVIDDILPFTCPNENVDVELSKFGVGHDLPSVLYGNPGLAKRTPFNADMHMLNLFNAQEMDRVIEEFRVEPRLCAGRLSLLSDLRTWNKGEFSLVNTRNG